MSCETQAWCLAQVLHLPAATPPSCRESIPWSQQGSRMSMHLSPCAKLDGDKRILLYQNPWLPPDSTLSGGQNENMKITEQTKSPPCSLCLQAVRSTSNSQLSSCPSQRWISVYLLVLGEPLVLLEIISFLLKLMHSFAVHDTLF